MTDHEALVYLLSQYDRLLEIHRHVAMDTPEDCELHDRAVAAADAAATPIRQHLGQQ